MFSTLTEKLIVGGLFALLLGGSVGGFAWHEREIGIAVGNVKCVEKGEKLVAKNDSAVAVAEHAATVGAARQAEDYHAKADQPVTGAPVYRVRDCPAATGGRQVLPAAGAGSGAHAADAVRAGDTGPPPASWDSAAVVVVGRKADAEVTYLREYVLHQCLRR